MDARSVLDLLDLTLLDHDASEADLDALCQRANTHRPAAVCVFSEHVAYVRSRLDDGIALAAVAGGFPVGDDNPSPYRSRFELRSKRVRMKSTAS